VIPTVCDEDEDSGTADAPAEEAQRHPHDPNPATAPVRDAFAQEDALLKVLRSLGVESFAPQLAGAGVVTITDLEFISSPWVGFNFFLKKLKILKVD